MSQMGKVESGAQLLARLGSRPTPQSWDSAKWLGFDPSPGDIVEICGNEGVGKSELLLNLVATALLPTTREQHGNGLQPQAVWVDCDLKFSVLRLAVLLEHRVLSCETDKSKRDQAENSNSAMESQWKIYDEKREDERQLFDSLAHQKGPHNCKQKEEVPTRTGLKGSGVSICTSNVAMVTDSPCTGSLKAESSALKRKAEEIEGEDAGGSQFHQVWSLCHCQKECKLPHPLIEDSNQSHSVQRLHVTAATSERGSKSCGEDIEKKVLECLEHVHVARCMSSQQLICTLCSVEAQIAANPNIALLVIDSISAFFWSDKCSDFNSAYLIRNVSHIASVLQNIAQSYGVLVVATKQALLKPRVKDGINSRVSLPVKSNAPLEEEGPVEFLGSVWKGIVTKQLVCSKTIVCHKGVSRTRYTLSGTQERRCFTINEDGMRFDEK